MKRDIILAGVGGQGILTIAYVIDNAALYEGFNFKQAEVHGMAQRGGAVQSHLRISNGEIASDLVPRGKCDLILSVEPLEALRYVEYLHPEGMVVSSAKPFINIPNYPDEAQVLDQLRLTGAHRLIQSDKLAAAAGSKRSENIVMVGAASPFLPFAKESYRKFIQQLFGAKGEDVVESNYKALEFGRQAGELYEKHLEAGLSPRDAVEKATAEATA